MSAEVKRRAHRNEPNSLHTLNKERKQEESIETHKI